MWVVRTRHTQHGKGGAEGAIATRRARVELSRRDPIESSGTVQTGGAEEQALLLIRRGGILRTVAAHLARRARRRAVVGVRSRKAVQGLDGTNGAIVTGRAEQAESGVNHLRRTRASGAVERGVRAGRAGNLVAGALRAVLSNSTGEAVRLARTTRVGLVGTCGTGRLILQPAADRAVMTCTTGPLRGVPTTRAVHASKARRALRRVVQVCGGGVGASRARILCWSTSRRTSVAACVVEHAIRRRGNTGAEVACGAGHRNGVRRVASPCGASITSPANFTLIAGTQISLERVSTGRASVGIRAGRSCGTEMAWQARCRKRVRHTNLSASPARFTRTADGTARLGLVRASRARNRGSETDRRAVVTGGALVTLSRSCQLVLGRVSANRATILKSRSCTRRAVETGRARVHGETRSTSRTEVAFRTKRAACAGGGQQIV